MTHNLVEHRGCHWKPPRKQLARQTIRRTPQNGELCSPNTSGACMRWTTVPLPRRDVPESSVSVDPIHRRHDDGTSLRIETPQHRPPGTLRGGTSWPTAEPYVLATPAEKWNCTLRDTPPSMHAYPDPCQRPRAGTSTRRASSP